MKESVKLSVKERLKYNSNVLVRQESSYHIFFWVSLYVILILLDTQTAIGLRFIKQLVNVSFFALIAYFNMGILFPKYLRNRNLLLHIILVALLAVLITPIKAVLMYLITPDKIDLQPYLLSNLFSIFFSSFFIGLASSQFSILREWGISQQEKSNLQRQKLESELKFLKSQINPHFLFNTLNSLYAHTLKKSDNAPEIVLKLSEAMRYMLYECNVSEIALSKEVNYLKNYLELEKLRHADDVQISFDVHGEIDEQMISPLLFIPFIENAFKHGLSSGRKENYVHVDLYVDGRDVKLIVLNPVCPRDEQSDQPVNSGGFGLENIRKRLKLIYPDSHNLKIIQTNEFYKVILDLKIKNHQYDYQSNYS